MAIKKPQLDAHTRRCQQAQFTCLDCNTDFYDGNYRYHTQCITEAEKYEKAKPKGKQQAKKQAPKPERAGQSPIVPAKAAPKQQQLAAGNNAVPASIVAQLKEQEAGQASTPSTPEATSIKRKADKSEESKPNKRQFPELTRSDQVAESTGKPSKTQRNAVEKLNGEVGEDGRKQLAAWRQQSLVGVIHKDIVSAVKAGLKSKGSAVEIDSLPALAKTTLLSHPSNVHSKSTVKKASKSLKLKLSGDRLEFD
ncbi:hypothetical protein IWQ60_006804 [Tieghemiomyces parasiticus]|uniref:Zinc finger C2H2 LYAR-type domain-containing protein n=1 Tax=Tieghemiomyces parasiticus TaxID=78921 RepID=A0A9W8AA15_9FUNG|nr:hypothetical protein IWQ60_006804 [Tieghemiomyces parasiticus]